MRIAGETEEDGHTAATISAGPPKHFFPGSKHSIAANHCG